MGSMLKLLFVAMAAHASFIDFGPVQDSSGHPEVDLYDATGAERGTLSNPLGVALPQDATPATQNITAQDTATTSVTVANNQITYSGTPTAGSAASFAINSVLTVGLEFTGTWTGTVQIEVSQDGGATWNARSVKQTAVPIFVSTFTQNMNGQLNVSSKTNVRVRALTAMTGTLTVSLRTSQNLSTVYVGNALKIVDGSSNTSLVQAVVKAPSTAPAATDAAFIVGLSPNGNHSTAALQSTGNSSLAQIASNTIQVTQGAALSGQTGSMDMGSVSAAAPSYSAGGVYPISLNAAGGLRVDGSGVTQPVSGTVNTIPLDGTKASYSATAVAFTASATAPSDIFTITGSATKTIRITKITFTGSQTTATQRDVLVLKRSTANSGGTSTTIVAVPHDSTNPAATAVVKAYTANPTVGTFVGTITARKVFIATTTTNSDEMILDWGDRPTQEIVLRGTGETVAVDLNGVVSAGSSLDIKIEWSEE